MKKIIIIILVLLVLYFVTKSTNKEVEAPVILPPTENPEAPANGDGSQNPTPSPLPSPDSINSSEAAKTALATELKVASNSITVVSATVMEWSDSCLGLGGAAEICAAVITPGYKVTLSANGKTYVYRTDATGSVVRKEK